MSLLDGKPVNAKFGDENFDDQVMARWGSFGITTVYIDSLGNVGTINSKGYKKYCYIYSPFNPNDSAELPATYSLILWIMDIHIKYGR